MLLSDVCLMSVCRVHLA